MTRKWFLPVVVLVAVLATIIVNSLANILPFNGQTTGEISNRYPVLFVPAGYVFSIWGLIYLQLVIFGVYQVLPTQLEDKTLVRIRGWFLISSLANMAWILCWHFERFSLSLVVMMILLASLLIIYLRLAGAKMIGQNSKAQRWLVRLPFSVYLGWISVATIANASFLFTLAGWNGWGISPTAWTVIMLAVATLLAIAMAVLQRDWAYVLVLIWAFAGIALKPDSPSLVIISAWIAAGICLAAVAWSVYRSMQPVSPAA